MFAQGICTAVLASIAVVTATISPAVAQQPSVTLGRSTMERVPVWRDYDAWKEGVALIRANVHTTDPQMVLRLFACYPVRGTKAVVVESAALAAKTILVIDGPDKGCKGMVTVEDIN